jgi:hypothetical protein
MAGERHGMCELALRVMTWMLIRFIMQMTEMSNKLSHDWWSWDHQVATSHLMVPQNHKTLCHCKCKCCSLLVIHKYNQPTQFRKAPRLPVHYKAQKIFWMDKDIFLDCVTSMFFLPKLCSISKHEASPKLVLSAFSCSTITEHTVWIAAGIWVQMCSVVYRQM